MFQFSVSVKVLPSESMFQFSVSINASTEIAPFQQKFPTWECDVKKLSN